jgi:hypothetical protein
VIVNFLSFPLVLMRCYTRRDTRILKSLKKLYVSKKFIGKGKSKCCLVLKVFGIRHKRKKIKNPLYNKYKKCRQEPKHLEPHQIEFIVKNCHSPKKGLNLSHLCGRHNCIINGHMVCETIGENIRRKSCHQRYKKFIKQQRRNRVKGCILLTIKDVPWTCCHSEKDEEKCFYNSS